MKPLTPEWVAKAEQDYQAAEQLHRSREAQFSEIVCFHCQQCAEKYLKARLQEAEIPFPKTHDLEQLLDLVLPVEPLWESLRRSISQLTDYAVELRYPGDTANVEEATRALAVAKTVRKLVRQGLGADGNVVRERGAVYRAKRKVARKKR